MQKKKAKFTEKKELLDKLLIGFYNTFNESKYSKWLMLVFFSLIEFWIIKEHVFWRDDTRPILIATLNESFADFYTEMRYESTPMLYHLFLWFIKGFIPLTIFNVKFIFLTINILILVTIIFLIRIPNIYRLLILLQVPMLGYLNYIRQYSWAILFIMLFTYFYQKSRDKSIWIYILLFLMCQTCIHSCIGAVGLYLFILFNRFNDKERLTKPPDLILLLGFLLCCLQITQPPDIINGLKSIKPFFSPINLDFTFTFINQVFLRSIASSYGLCIIIWYNTKKLIKENRILNIAFYSSVSSIALVFYLIGTLRYYSLDRHLWILSYIIISLLIILNKDFPHKIRKLSVLRYLLLLLLFVNAYNYIDLVKGTIQAESTANKTAEYLDKYYSNKLTLHEHDFLTDAINIHRKEIRYYYSLDTHKFYKYVRWNHNNVDFFRYFKEGLISLKISNLVQDIKNTPDVILKQEPIVILSADKITNDTKLNIRNININKKYKLSFLTQFCGGGLENFAIYQVKKI